MGRLGRPATGEAIFEAIAHGRIDHYVLRPSRAARRAVPPRDLGLAARVGATRSARRRTPSTSSASRGRAGPTSCASVLGRCAVPHASAWPTPTKGASSSPRPATTRGSRSMVLPDGTVLSDPIERRDRGGGRPAGRPRRTRLRRRHRRRRAGGPVGRGLRRLRGVPHAGRRRGRDRRPGDLQLADPQLPRLPPRRQRPPARRAGLRAGVGVRRELRVHAARDRASTRRTTGSRVDARGRRPVSARAVILATAPATAGSASPRSRR